MEADPAVAAAAAQITAETTQDADRGAPYGRDANERPIVPGFTADPIRPEPLLPGEEAPAPQPETAVAEVELPSFEADTNGIEDLLEPEDTAEAEPEPPVFDDGDEDEPGEYEDPQLQKANAKLRKLEKQLEWERQQRVQQGQKNWRAEASRRFPLADVNSITADSRRGFLREAASQHERVATLVAPHLETIRRAQQSVIEETKQEARQDARAAWGQPTVGPPQPVIQHAETAGEEQALDRRNFRTLQDRVSALMKAGKIGI